MSRSQNLIALMVALAFLLAGLFVPAAHAKPLSEGGYLGVYTRDLDVPLLEALDFDGEGVLIEDVVGGSPADEAGIMPGDILMSADDKTILSTTSLKRLLWRHDPGDRLALALWRDGDTKRIDVTLGTPEPRGFTWSGEDMERALRLFTPKTYGFLGVHLHDLTDQLAAYFGVDEGGVLVEKVLEDSPAQKAGLRAGDVIVSLDGEAVASGSQLRTLLQQRKPEQNVQLTLVRDRDKSSLEVTLGEAEGMTFGLAPDLNLNIPADSLRTLEKHIRRVMPRVRVELEQLRRLHGPEGLYDLREYDSEGEHRGYGVPQ